MTTISSLKLFLPAGMYEPPKEVPLRIFTFPGGEMQVRILETEELWRSLSCTVLAHIRDSEGMMALSLLRDAIFNVNKESVANLIIPYLPYARQDRVCFEGEASSGKLIQQQLVKDWNSVTVADAHSKPIDGIREIAQSTLFSQMSQVPRVNEYTVIAPDEGARLKAYRSRGVIGNENLMVYGKKERNPDTGEIIAFSFNGNVKGKRCLIVDDMCDGGGTFIGLAKELKEGGALSVSLYVTHGIFSKGVSHLLDNGISRIYTTDSFCTLESRPGLTVFKYFTKREI